MVIIIICYNIFSIIWYQLYKSTHTTFMKE